MKPSLSVLTLASSVALASLCSLPTLAQDWQGFNTAMQQGIEDRQQLMNDFFNDEAPHHHFKGWPSSRSHFMAIAQGNHLISDRSNGGDSAWQDRHQHPHNQWNDLVWVGKPAGNWRYFVNFNLTEPELTIDEAHITLPLLPLTQFKLGQFYSGFGRLNSQHPHDRDFIDTPMIYQRLFGDSSLLEKGVQLSVSPISNVMIAVEQLSAINQDQFNLPDTAKPALTNVFARWNQRWSEQTYALIGVSRAQGDSGDANGLKSSTQWSAVDFTLKQRLNNNRYWMLQAEYLERKSEQASSLNQQGHYAMLLYRWHEQWRAGIRNETAHSQVSNLSNTTRNALLIEYDANSWLRTRLQLGHEQQAKGVEGIYWLAGWQASFQWLH